MQYNNMQMTYILDIIYC